MKLIHPTQEFKSMKKLKIMCHDPQEKTIEEDTNDIMEENVEEPENIIKTEAEQNIPTAETEKNPKDITKYIMKIMTLNAIISTSKEETIKNPTIVNENKRVQEEKGICSHWSCAT